MPDYTRLTYDDRIKIEVLLRQKVKVTEIAAYIGCHRSSIYNEKKRGKYIRYGKYLEEKEVYSAEIAQKKIDINNTAKGVQLKIGNNHDIAKFIEDQILDGRSPYHAAEEVYRKFNIRFSVSTIYNYISSGLFLRITNKNLPYKGKRKYRQIRKIQKRLPIIGHSIDDRPKEVEDRNIFGHWELDTVIGQREGKSTCFMVLTERMTRNEVIRKIASRTMEDVVNAINHIELDLHKRNISFSSIFKTITCDNGSEFQSIDGIEISPITGRKRTRLYYCHPYRSGERGSNENQNRMIRRRHPKGMNLEKVSEEEVKRTQEWINTTRRKMFNGRTSKELFEEYIK